MGRNLSTATVVLALLFANVLYAPPVEAAGFSSVPSIVNGYINNLINFFGNIFNSPAPFPPSVTIPVVTHETTPPSPTPSTTTVINRTIYLPATSSPTITVSGITQAQLTDQIAALQAAIEAKTPAAAIVYDTATHSDSGQTLTNLTVSGVSGLTASDIPNLSGSYLSTAGGTLTGALINSSTATSTFAGAVGIGTASPSYSLDVSGFINTDQSSGYKQAGYTILSASSSNFSTQVGVGALASAQNGSTQNTAVGYNTLTSLTTNSYDTAIGYKAGEQYTGTVGGNHALTAIGGNAGGTITTGPDNTALGASAMFSTDNTGFTTGSDNLAVGVHTLTHLTSGSFNVAVGNESMVGCGNWTGFPACLLTGSDNTGIGQYTLENIQGIAAENTALGYSAGSDLTTGTENIFIGSFSGTHSVTTGMLNVLIGRDVRVPDDAGTGQLNIGNLIQGTGLTQGGAVSTGKVGIGTSSPTSLLSLTGSNSGTTLTTLGTPTLQIENANTTNNNFASLALRGVDANGAEFTGAKIVGVFTDHTAGAASGDLAFLTRNAGTEAEKMRITAAGNVGIGSTTPATTLSVAGSGYLTGGLGIGVENTTAGTVKIVSGTNDVGIILYDVGTATQGITLATNGTRGNLGLYNNGTQTISLNGNPVSNSYINLSTGNFGIGTTSPWRTLDVNGTVGFKGLTSVGSNQTAYLCLSSNNEVVQDSTTCLASSRRFKQDIAPLDASSSLAEVLALTPVSFEYTPSYNGALQSNPNFSGTFVGFIAEDVAKIDPRLITVDATGPTPTAPHGVRYENITALLAGAVQDIASISGVFRDNLIAWLGSASNGINDLFAKNIYGDNVYAHQVTADKLCAKTSDGSPVCVTGDQLKALLSGQGSAGTSAPESDTTASTTRTTDATSTPSTSTGDAATSNPPDTSTAPSTDSTAPGQGSAPISDTASSTTP
jgi:hypothetical protein